MGSSRKLRRISKSKCNAMDIDELIKQVKESLPGRQATRRKRGGSRANSDEYYVIDLCDEALGLKGIRQHRFPFLLGDSGRPLPVDVYYRERNLVIEYYERQHTEKVKIYDQRMTVSGVLRGEQRKIYDERRRTELPKHGIKLVIISYSDFGMTKKLNRNHDADLRTVREILRKNGVIK